MGDFNENMDMFRSLNAKGKSTNSYQFRFLFLMSKLIDSIKHFTKPPFSKTWNDITRIDGIFFSETLLPHFNKAYTDLNVPSGITDHHMIQSNLDIPVIYIPIHI